MLTEVPEEGQQVEEDEKGAIVEAMTRLWRDGAVREAVGEFGEGATRTKRYGADPTVIVHRASYQLNDSAGVLPFQLSNARPIDSAPS